MFFNNPQISASLAFLSLLTNLIAPQSVISDQVENDKVSSAKVEMMSVDNPNTLRGQALVQSSNPEGPKIQREFWVLVTAYSSTPDQTDSSPFITANGSRVREGIVACNFLPFGAKVRFPQLGKNKIYMVEDRMAKKNSHKIDIWFSSRAEAKQFGVKLLKVEVLEI